MKFQKDIFECLILVKRLTALKDKDISSRISTIMERDPETTLQKVTVSKDNQHQIDDTCIEEKISRV